MRMIGFLFVAAGIAVCVLFAAYFLIDTRPADGSEFSRPFNGTLPSPAPEPRRREIGEPPPKDELLTDEEWEYYYSGRDLPYEVREGDDLASLARKYLGDPARAKAILEANPQLRLRRRLLPGDTIVIPMRERR